MAGPTSDCEYGVLPGEAVLTLSPLSIIHRNRAQDWRGCGCMYGVRGSTSTVTDSRGRECTADTRVDLLHHPQTTPFSYQQKSGVDCQS